MMSGFSDERWIHGSPDCAQDADPPLQARTLGEGVLGIRQNKCLNYEAPFLYLLFGEKKALLIDTGADPGPGRELPLRELVQTAIKSHLQGRPEDRIELIVAHSHSHSDHTFADGQFEGEPGVTVVPPNLRGIRSFFGLEDWPSQEATLDLGGRLSAVIPVPGHEATHLAFHDPQTGLLLTGDTLYPGYLYVSDWQSYRRSIAKLARIATERRVDRILGAHIEMKRFKGEAYPPQTSYQPDERTLELLPEHLLALNAALAKMGDQPTRTVFDDFILEPLGA